MCLLEYLDSPFRETETAIKKGFPVPHQWLPGRLHRRLMTRRPHIRRMGLHRRILLGLYIWRRGLVEFLPIYHVEQPVKGYLWFGRSAMSQHKECLVCGVLSNILQRICRNSLCKMYFIEQPVCYYRQKEDAVQHIKLPLSTRNRQ